MGGPYLLRHCVSDPRAILHLQAGQGRGALTCRRIPSRRCTARRLSAVTKSTRSWTWTTLPQLKIPGVTVSMFSKTTAPLVRLSMGIPAAVSSFSGISPTLSRTVSQSNLISVPGIGLRSAPTSETTTCSTRSRSPSGIAQCFGLIHWSRASVPHRPIRWPPPASCGAP